MNLLETTNIGDSLINAVSILLILSLVAERLANLVKLYLVPKERHEAVPRHLYIPLIERYWIRINNRIEAQPLTTAQKDIVFAKYRERYVIWLSILSGLVVAMAVGANFFSIIKSNEAPSIWEGTEFSWREVLGILITGLFLSMGSKFFHDVLGILVTLRKGQRATKELDISKIRTKEQAELALDRKDEELYVETIKVLKEEIGLADDDNGIIIQQGAYREVVIYYLPELEANLPDKISSIYVQPEGWRRQKIEIKWIRLDIQEDL